MSTTQHVEGRLWTTTGTSCRVHVDQRRDTGRWEIHAESPEDKETLTLLGTHAGLDEALLFASDVADGRLFLTEHMTPELLDGTIKLTFDDEPVESPERLLAKAVTEALAAEYSLGVAAATANTQTARSVAVTSAANARAARPAAWGREFGSGQ